MVAGWPWLTARGDRAGLSVLGVGRGAVTSAFSGRFPQSAHDAGVAGGVPAGLGPDAQAVG